MKTKIILLLSLISTIGFAQEQCLDADKQAKVEEIISLFQGKNPANKLSKKVVYPLKRLHPLPDVKNEREFKQRFAQIFDASLITLIANSSIKQWEDVGGRGIMLDAGIVWIDSDSGKITSINYESDVEMKQRTELISIEKESLHRSLRNFESPIFKIKTKNYLIRIDLLSDQTYRYASWKVIDAETSKPDLILRNGTINFEGSGGNHNISFVNGDFTYRVFRYILGSGNEPDVTLEVYKDNRMVLTEDGTLVE